MERDHSELDEETDSTATGRASGGDIFRLTVDLDGVPEGYNAVGELEAIKGLVIFDE